MYAAEVVGKRVRYRLDGSKILKVSGIDAVVQCPRGQVLVGQLNVVQICPVLLLVVTMKGALSSKSAKLWTRSITGSWGMCAGLLGPQGPQHDGVQAGDLWRRLPKAHWQAGGL
jgi:hypothetical protein